MKDIEIGGWRNTCMIREPHIKYTYMIGQKHSHVVLLNHANLHLGWVGHISGVVRKILYFIGHDGKQLIPLSTTLSSL